MEDYSQPDFYHFSDSSIKLASFAASTDCAHCNVLDVFAGCGVIGLEYLKRVNLGEVKRLDFVERDERFRPHLEHNVKDAGFIHILDFKDFCSDRRYDVILANPPFFDRESNRESPTASSCRLWNQNERNEFLEFLKAQLAQGGRAFILLRPDQDFYKIVKPFMVRTMEINRELLAELRFDVAGLE